MSIENKQNNKVSGTNTDSKDEIIIDKVDCLQRDFAGFKGFLIQYIDDKIDSAVREIRKRKPYVEVGYRG